MFGQGFDRILASARLGEETAWTSLYLDLAPVLTGYLTGQRCPSPEDVTAEALYQVVRDLHRFRGEETAFRSWVFTIAHHRMIDARRYASVRPAAPAADEFLQRHGSSDSFEDHTVAALDGSVLDELLAVMTPDQRDVVLLRYVADLSLHEAAEVLGKEYNAVKALHRRALDALRDHVTTDAYPKRIARALTSSG